MNLVKLLLKTVEAFPQKLAIIDKNHSCSFNQYREKGFKLGALLKKKNINKGDYVLVLHPMSIELYIVLMGLWSIGAIPLFFDISAGRKHIQKCCSMITPKAFIGSNKAQLLRFYSKEIRKMPIKISTEKNIFMSSIHEYETSRWSDVEELEEDFPALVTFTSGSTGEPKAALRTHGFLRKQYEVLTQCLHFRSDEIDLATFPIVTLASLVTGMTSVIPDADLRHVGSINPGKVIKQIQKHQISRISASPSFIKCLINYCQKHTIKLDSLTEVVTGGGPVFPSVMKRIKEIMPRSNLVIAYGSTEAEPIAEINWEDINENDDKLMAKGGGLPVGNPVQYIKCKVIKAEWDQPIYTLSETDFDNMNLQHEVGEIVVSGDHVLKGYLNGVGDEENKFSVGYNIWHRTGDMGYFDDTGRLWLMGRASAVIKDAKGELYPFSVECAVNANFGIELSALISLKGLRILILENKDWMKVDLTEKLDWAKLDTILYVKKIPVDKRHNAKIDYPALKRLLER